MTTENVPNSSSGLMIQSLGGGGYRIFLKQRVYINFFASFLTPKKNWLYLQYGIFEGSLDVWVWIFHALLVFFVDIRDKKRMRISKFIFDERKKSLVTTIMI